jgi:transposase
MGEKAKRRRFSPEIRQNVVKLVMEGGRKCSEVSAEHGVPEASVYAWVRQARLASAEAANGDATSEKSLREENLRLRRELKDARDQALFLRKTAAFFASRKP